MNKIKLSSTPTNTLQILISNISVNIMQIKVKNDQRSKFSNLSHIFQASSFLLLKLENLLR